MLKLVNGLVIIGAVGLLMMLIFLAGQGLAQSETMISTLVEHWYLVIAFLGCLSVAWLTSRKGAR